MSDRGHPGRQPARFALSWLLASALALASGSALAYWELAPRLDAGITWENNPRYVSGSLKEGLGGLFTNLGASGGYRTTADQISLSADFRQTNYLKSNKDLNDDDWSTSLTTSHSGERGSVGLSAAYSEYGIRTGEFESATPGDPDAPPETSGASARFADGTQNSENVGANLTYNLSRRNVAALDIAASETTYDVPSGDRLINGYFDYRYASASLGMSHYLNAKNFLQLGLTGSNFTAEQPITVSGNTAGYKNTTGSFGLNVSYNRVLTPSLSATGRVGIARSSIDISPFLVSDEDRNFTGAISIRQRSERTTLNFDISRGLAPRSNGIEVVEDEFRVYINRALTGRLSANAGTIFTMASAVGVLGELNQSTRLDTEYFTFDTGMSYQLTPTLSAYGRYSYVSSADDAPGSLRQTNNRLYFGVSYRGLGFRH